MKFLALVFLLLTSDAFACWKMKAVMSVDADEINIDQKLDHDKVYSFPSGKYIYNVKIPSAANIPANIPKKPGMHFVDIDVVEKVGMTLKPISHGQILVKTGKEATMTTKDDKTNQTTSFKVTLTEI